MNNKSKIQTCQKCLKYGHFTYECKNNPIYNYRPSKTSIVNNKIQVLNSILLPNRQKTYKNKDEEENKKKNREEEDEKNEDKTSSISRTSSESYNSSDISKNKDKYSSDSDLSEEHIEIRRLLKEKYEDILQKREFLNKKKEEDENEDDSN